MFSKELSLVLASSLPHLRLDTVIAALATLVCTNVADYDTVWDLSNRVCDRYMTERKSAA